VNDAIFLAGPDGKKICDLLITCDQNNKNSMDVIKTLFTETVKSLESKSEELIKAEISRLEKIVVDLQSKQQLAVDSGAKSDA
jgi:hypothetical protein